ncbi:hypothetical protein AN958_12383 [Leucoagaricus sp. SymC.cos]|nr:hypothetical protein AN958_12383 [Leucoagaricus sp. SymC.cos]
MAHGVRGWQVLPEDDPLAVDSDYGVEYEVIREAPQLTRELAEMSNDNRDQDAGPLTVPAAVSCEAPNCPLPPGQVQILSHLLGLEVDMDSEVEAVRRRQWEKGLEILELLIQADLPDNITPEHYGL